VQALGLLDRGVGGVDGEGGGRDGGQVLDEGGVEGLEFGRCADHVPCLNLLIDEHYESYYPIATDCYS